jgi:hypothetical protein
VPVLYIRTLSEGVRARPAPPELPAWLRFLRGLRLFTAFRR